MPPLALVHQRTQFAMDQGQQLLGGVWVALVDGRRDAGDIGYRFYLGGSIFPARCPRTQIPEWRFGIFPQRERLTWRADRLFPAPGDGL